MRNHRAHGAIDEEKAISEDGLPTADKILLRTESSVIVSFFRRIVFGLSRWIARHQAPTNWVRDDMIRAKPVTQAIFPGLSCSFQKETFACDQKETAWAKTKSSEEGTDGFVALVLAPPASMPSSLLMAISLVAWSSTLDGGGWPKCLLGRNAISDDIGLATS